MSIQDDLDPDDPTSKEIRRLTGRGDIYVSRSTPIRRDRPMRRERPEPAEKTSTFINLDVEPFPDTTPQRIHTGYTAARRREYEILEKPFAEKTEALRQTGKRLREEARGKHGPPSGKVFVERGDPEQMMGEVDTEKLKTTYVRASTPPPIAEGVGLAIRAGASAVDAFTAPARPIFMAQSAHSAARIVIDAKTRTRFLEQVQRDPRGFLADIGGGIVGGYALGRGVRGIREVYTRRKYALDAPDEAFFTPDEMRAGGGRYRVPEIVDETRIDTTLLKETETRTLANGKFGRYADSAKTKFKDLDFDSSAKLWDKTGVKKTSLNKTFREGYVPSGGRAAELVPLLDDPLKIDYVVPVTLRRTGYGVRPGITFRDISPTLARPFPFGMTVYGGATALKVMDKAIPKVDQPISPVQGRRQIQLAGHTQIQRPRIAPLQKPRPIDPAEITRTYTDPGFVPRPPELIHITRQRTRAIIDLKQELRQRTKAIAPTLPGYGFQELRPRTQIKIRVPELKARGEIDYLKNVFAGEFRGYKMKSPKEILELI